MGWEQFRRFRRQVIDNPNGIDPRRPLVDVIQYTDGLHDTAEKSAMCALLSTLAVDRSFTTKQQPGHGLDHMNQ